MEKLKTRLDTNKQLREYVERVKRGKKYLIVWRHYVEGIYTSRAAADRRAVDDGGIVVGYVDKLPEGINEYEVQLWNDKAGEWYTLTTSGWTAKTLWYWWKTDGQGDVYPWQWKGKKQRFLVNGDVVGFVNDERKYNFSFPEDPVAAPALASDGVAVSD